MSDAATRGLKEGYRQFDIEMGKVTIEGYYGPYGWRWPDVEVINGLLREACEKIEQEAAPARAAAAIIDDAIAAARAAGAKPYILSELKTVRRHAIMEAADCVHEREIVIYQVERDGTINSLNGWTFYLERIDAKKD